MGNAGGGIRIGTIAGIAIRIDYSWLFIFFFVLWSLSSQYFPDQNPSWPALTAWSVGLVATVLFFASVMLHELGHSAVALRLGVPVRSITLFIFGGVSRLEKETDRPRDEFWMAVVGPLTSLLLAGFFGLLWLLTRDVFQPAAAASSYLALVNLLLAGFNLIPGYPLDGGRVLRAVLWWANNRVVLATRIASMVGRGIAYLFMFGGLWVLFQGGWFNGLWFILIGWFLNSAAESSYRQVLIQSLLKGTKISTIVTHEFATVRPGTTLRDLVDNHFLRHNYHAFPVTIDSRLLGLVTLNDIKKVPQGEWDNTYVTEAMTKRENLRVVTPEDDVMRAFQILTELNVGQIPVVEGEALVGLVTRAHLLQFVQVRSALGVEG